MFTIVGAQGFDFVTVATRSDMARIRIWNGPEIWRIGRCRLDGTRLAVSVGHVFAKARTVLVPYMTDSGRTMLKRIGDGGTKEQGQGLLFNQGQDRWCTRQGGKVDLKNSANAPLGREYL